MAAFDAKEVGLHAKVKVRLEGKLIDTTVGKVFFNQVVPKELGFFNEVASKSKLEGLVSESCRRLGNYQTSLFLDNLKKLGFEYATLGGITVGIDDMIIPPEKANLIERAQKEVDKIQKQYEKGIITNGERYNKVIQTPVLRKTNQQEITKSNSPGQQKHTQMSHTS